MGAECSKAVHRRLREPLFAQKFFVGRGLDVGAGNDSLGRYVRLFPRLESVDTFDVPGSGATYEGDATWLEGVPSGSYDFVHASHVLEHLKNLGQALTSWLRVVYRRGHVIVLVPDAELYEGNRWPSLYNTDHKWCFLPGPTVEGYAGAGQPKCSVLHLLTSLEVPTMLVHLQRLEATYRPEIDEDQTLGIGECSIEIVLRKL